MLCCLFGFDCSRTQILSFPLGQKVPSLVHRAILLFITGLVASHDYDNSQSTFLRWGRRGEGGLLSISSAPVAAITSQVLYPSLTNLIPCQVSSSSSSFKHGCDRQRMRPHAYRPSQAEICWSWLLLHAVIPSSAAATKPSRDPVGGAASFCGL